MKADYTDITVVIDRSCSMWDLKNEVIGGFNSFIDDQKKIKGAATVTLVQFDDRYEVNYKGKNIQDVPNLSHETYIPRGLTAMYDAIGKTIVSTGERLASMKECDRPSKVIFIIQTDGEENASEEYCISQIKKMIEEQEKVYSWEFVFIGANINAKNTASNIGIKKDKAMTFAFNSKGAKEAFNSISNNVAKYRSGVCDSMRYTSEDYKAQLNAGAEQ